MCKLMVNVFIWQTCFKMTFVCRTGINDKNLTNGNAKGFNCGKKLVIKGFLMFILNSLRNLRQQLSISFQL